MFEEIVNACALVKDQGFSVEEVEAIARQATMEHWLWNNGYCRIENSKNVKVIVAELIEKTGYDPVEVERFAWKQHLRYPIQEALDFATHADVAIALKYWKMAHGGAS